MLFAVGVALFCYIAYVFKLYEKVSKLTLVCVKLVSGRFQACLEKCGCWKPNERSSSDLDKDKQALEVRIENAVNVFLTWQVNRLLQTKEQTYSNSVPHNFAQHHMSLITIIDLSQSWPNQLRQNS